MHVSVQKRTSMTKNYDAIIVGAGPAGIFASLELSDAGLNVLLLDKGREIDARVCPVQKGSERCVLCSPCHLVSGFGGAGALSDGKLTLSTEVGGRLQELIGLGPAEALVDYVDSVYLKFGAPKKVYGTGGEIAELERQATLADLKLIPVRLRHLGTEHCPEVLKAMHDYLSSKLDIRLGTTIKDIVVEEGC